VKDMFLPPGVQARLWERFGFVPRQADETTVAQVEALWLKRNQAPEEQLTTIDDEMYRLAALVVEKGNV
jgi:hypothetical protein